MLKVTNFLFKTTALLLACSGTGDNQNRHWLEALHADHIRRIHIDIMIDPPSTATSAHLDSLYQHVTMIASHPTALQELVIKGWDEQDVHLRNRHIPLPSLRVYDGPSRLFEVLHTGKDLHTLTLHGDPWAALRQLRPQSRSIDRMELHVETFSFTDVAIIEKVFSVGIRINHLGMHARFSDPDTMYALNKACMVPGLGIKTLSYSYLRSRRQ
jgi:hypothetical protein